MIIRLHRSILLRSSVIISHQSVGVSMSLIRCHALASMFLFSRFMFAVVFQIQLTIHKIHSMNCAQCWRCIGSWYDGDVGVARSSEGRRAERVARTHGRRERQRVAVWRCQDHGRRRWRRMSIHRPPSSTIRTAHTRSRSAPSDLAPTICISNSMAKSWSSRHTSLQSVRTCASLSSQFGCRLCLCFSLCD